MQPANFPLSETFSPKLTLTGNQGTTATKATTAKTGSKQAA
jgi:hypothetical protein